MQVQALLKELNKKKVSSLLARACECWCILCGASTGYRLPARLGLMAPARDVEGEEGSVRVGV